MSISVTDRERTTIDRIRHPDYTLRYNDWQLYRRTYEGGTHYVKQYLKKFSSRETNLDFCRRRDITYCPAHAKAAIIDVRNAIYQRMVDIRRRGGPASYQSAIHGIDGGVDLRGNTMDGFIGRMILPELLVLGRVGVFVDKEPLGPNATKAQADAIRPYLYYYRAEDVLSWHMDRNNQLTTLLLRDYSMAVDESTGLPSGTEESFRLLKLTPEGVVVEIHKGVASGYLNGRPQTTMEITDARLLNLKRIPFVFFDIGQSLFKDIAGHQIALLNLTSSDINYALKSNFPFYTEQYNPNTQSPHIKYGQNTPIADSLNDGCATDLDCATDDCDPKTHNLAVGTRDGRAYPKGTERPAFIHPSSEPLRASMEKQEQLKTEIRQLVNLAITNIAPMRASAESKEHDDRGLEAGLSYIGLELEHGEREISKIWTQYEGGDAPVIKYPDSYTLRSNAERRQEAKELRDLMPTVPSKRFQKVLAKDIARITVGGQISADELKAIEKEIEDAEVVVSDPQTVRDDLEAGLVGAELASKIRGYPEGEVEKSNKDHAARLARIQAAQTNPDDQGNMGARGVRDASVHPGMEAKLEKELSRETAEQETTADRTRGEGRNNDE